MSVTLKWVFFGGSENSPQEDLFRCKNCDIIVVKDFKSHAGHYLKEPANPNLTERIKIWLGLLK